MECWPTSRIIDRSEAPAPAPSAPKGTPGPAPRELPRSPPRPRRGAGGPAGLREASASRAGGARPWFRGNPFNVWGTAPRPCPPRPGGTWSLAAAHLQPREPHSRESPATAGVLWRPGYGGRVPPSPRPGPRRAAICRKGQAVARGEPQAGEGANSAARHPKARPQPGRHNWGRPQCPGQRNPFPPPKRSSASVQGVIPGPKEYALIAAPGVEHESAYPVRTLLPT